MPHCGAGVGDTNKIMPAHRSSLSNDKGTNTKHMVRWVLWWREAGGQGGGVLIQPAGSWRGRCFSRCWFYILYLYFQEVWALAILCPNSRQCLNSVINCFQHVQSFYTLSMLLIYACWFDWTNSVPWTYFDTASPRKCTSGAGFLS